MWALPGTGETPSRSSQWCRSGVAPRRAGRSADADRQSSTGLVGSLRDPTSRTRRDDREYRRYVREGQRRPRGCVARRMQTDFHHGLAGLRQFLPAPRLRQRPARRSERADLHVATRLQIEQPCELDNEGSPEDLLAREGRCVTSVVVDQEQAGVAAVEQRQTDV